jgi:HAD superfamily hydrolase (TIGR01549 family)
MTIDVLTKSDLVLFDLDGTLVDSKRAIVKALKLTINSHPRVNDDTISVEKLIGRSLNNILSVHLSQEDVPSATQMYRNLFLEYLESEVQLFDGVENALELLVEKKIQLMVVTNRDSKTTKKILEYFQIGSFFSGVFGSDQGIPKPSNDLIFKAIKQAQVEIENTVFLGDTTIDYDAAKSAGTGFILFDPGRNVHANLPDNVNSFHNWRDVINLYF